MTKEEIKNLLKKEAFPHKTNYLELKETYISWLIFTGDFVYKIKKPVKYGYLDFSSLKKREFFCKEELRLNQRLSKDIYLEVVKIVEKGKNLFFIPLKKSLSKGEKIKDYALKMRQIPQEYCLFELIKKRKFKKEKIKNLARKIALFHKMTENCPKRYGWEVVKFNWQENFEQTKKFVGKILNKALFGFIKKAIEKFLTENKDLFFERIKQEKIKDCHGDLHSGNIFITPDQIYIIDCIEFNKRFRYQDTASDVAFLTMDLEYLKRKDLAKEFLKEYNLYLKDETLFEILPFYQCYRAYVRAKVGCFSLPKQDIFSIQNYFSLALKYAFLCLKKKPFLIILFGPVGTGKSYLGKYLSKILGASYLNSDVIRKKMFNIPLFEHPKENLDKIYNKKISLKVYQKMINEGIKLAKEGNFVILDATFPTQFYRQLLIEKAKKQKIPYFFVECWASEKKILERLKKRETKKEVSDATTKVYFKLKGKFEPFVLSKENYLFLNREKDKVKEDANKILKKVLA